MRRSTTSQGTLSGRSPDACGAPSYDPHKQTRSVECRNDGVVVYAGRFAIDSPRSRLWRGSAGATFASASQATEPSMRSFPPMLSRSPVRPPSSFARLEVVTLSGAASAHNAAATCSRIRPDIQELSWYGLEPWTILPRSNPRRTSGVRAPLSGLVLMHHSTALSSSPCTRSHRQVFSQQATAYVAIWPKSGCRFRRGVRQHGQH